jgi:outer membrane protein TolC
MVWVAIVTVATAHTLDAQTPPPLTLTIDEAVARAVTEAPRVAEARAQQVAAEAMTMSRTALGRPAISASSSYLRTNHVDEFGVPQSEGGTRVIFPDLPNNYRARAELAVPVYTAGRVQALIASAAADRDAAAGDTRAITSEVRLDAAMTYWGLVTARARVGVLERASERADAVLADVRARGEAGLVPPNERSSAEAQRARQQVQLIQARNDAALAELRLARVVGAEPGQPLVTVTPVETASPSMAGLADVPVATLVARAREQRGERNALEDRQASLVAAAAATLAASRPQVAALVAFEPARPNPRFVPREDAWNNSWDVGVNVSWALWDGGRLRAERAAALARAEAVGHHIADLDAQIVVDVHDRVLALRSARAAAEASQQAVEAATEARRVVKERFDAGVMTSTDLLDADVALLNAELERTELIATIRIGEARLLRVVGGD